MRSYHPSTSGAYSLSENYVYTVEAMRQALGRLDEDGVLVVTRWLQDPPASRCVRQPFWLPRWSKRECRCPG